MLNPGEKEELDSGPTKDRGDVDAGCEDIAEVIYKISVFRIFALDM